MVTVPSFYFALLLSLYCKEQTAPASILTPALLLCNESCPDQIVDPPLHRPARELQFPRYGADGRITLSLLVASVFQVHIDRFCPVRLLAVPSAIQASTSFKSCLSTRTENLGLFRICAHKTVPPVRFSSHLRPFSLILPFFLTSHPFFSIRLSLGGTFFSRTALPGGENRARGFFKATAL